MVKLKIKLPGEEKPIDIAPTITNQYNDVTLLIDVMQVNEIQFLLSKVYHIGYY